MIIFELYLESIIATLKILINIKIKKLDLTILSENSIQDSYNLLIMNIDTFSHLLMEFN